LQRRSKARRKYAQLVLEGVRLIGDAVDAGVLPDFAFVTEDALRENDALRTLITHLETTGIDCLRVTPNLLGEMSDTETPQGVLAVFPWPEPTTPDDASLVLVIDGWRDPGNLGTALRTAAAAGVPLVALMPGTVDATNPKVLRAGMGAHFRVPVRSLGWDELRAQFPEHTVYLADMGGETPYDAADWTRPALVVVGEEAHGLSDDARALPHSTLHIPMQRDTESLNAAVSASLLIYAARRHAL
jgi:TrmH family RNA methyltransferase